MKGIMELDNVTVSYAHVTDGMKYALPPTIEQKMARLRARLIDARYDRESDTVIVTVKPPFIPAIHLRHRRCNEDSSQAV